MCVMKILIRILKALKSPNPDLVSLGREREPGVQSFSFFPSSALGLLCSGKVIRPFWGLGFLICKMEGLDSTIPKIL